MSTTITDIAHKAGVSKSTISRFLNGRYECMSVETRERIAQVIKEADYRPNALARSLKQKRTHTIAAIVANILNPFSTSIIRGIEDYCQHRGFNLILCNADDDPGKEKNYLEVLLTKQIDGLIINTTGKNNAVMESVCQQIPVVLIDRKVPELGCDTVTVDSVKGVRLLVNHLVALGRRDIALLTMPYDGISPRQERVDGYKAALAEHGIPFRPEFLIETETDKDAVRDKLEKLFSNAGPHPTAIFGFNNLMTMSIIKTLKHMKLIIPEDVAVIGFDDWEWAPLVEPPVTVIAQPAYDMGKKAASLLISRIQAKKASRKPAMIIYEPQLVPRKSCGECDCSPN